METSIKHHIFENKRIYVFGAGVFGENCIGILRDLNLSISGVMDNDLNKVGSKFSGIEIVSPCFISDDVIVVISSIKYEKEIFQQLIRLGYDKNNILFFDGLVDLLSDEKNNDVPSLLSPTVIQLPITHKCNMNCVMCGVHDHISETDILPYQYDHILSDRLFRNITAIGINGGEPFLRMDLLECVNVFIGKLEHLNHIFIISNGYFTDRINDVLPQIYECCKNMNVKLSFSVSVDGIGEVQDAHRGINRAFEYANRTCKMILDDVHKFADDFSVICTITKHNISRINEVVRWSQINNINVRYNVATENERIDNWKKVNDFTVFSDDIYRHLAIEFFYSLYMSTGQLKYYGLFLFLKDGIRLSDCCCKNGEWITLLPDGQIAFCAPRSKPLGSCLEESAYIIVEKNVKYFQTLVDTYCGKCGQYISGLNRKGKEMMYKDLIQNDASRW